MILTDSGRKPERVHAIARLASRSPFPVAVRWFLLALGALFIGIPLWVAFTASTYDVSVLIRGVPLLPSLGGFENYRRAIEDGSKNLGVDVGRMFLNTMTVALGISVGKVALSFLTAFAIVFFKFPGRNLVFGGLLVTLMLPVEVRIMPTYKVVADLGLVNSYVGLIVPLLVSATAVFMLRQSFLSFPQEIVEAAQLDGLGPLGFMRRILLPSSAPSLAALFIIMFIFGWNQYLWPLLVSTQDKYYTLLVGINRMLAVGDQQAEWHIVLATSMVSLIPPVIAILAGQERVMAGMKDTEK